MSKTYAVAYSDNIGQRRVSWCLFNGKDFGFYSDKQIVNLISQGNAVLSLKVDAEGKLVVDESYTPYLMVKSGLGFMPAAVEGGSLDNNLVNKYYALTCVMKNHKTATYHFITNRCGVEELDEAQVKTLLDVTDLGGVRMDAKRRLVVHPAVDVIELGSDDGTTEQGGAAE